MAFGPPRPSPIVDTVVSEAHHRPITATRFGRGTDGESRGWTRGIPVL